MSVIKKEPTRSGGPETREVNGSSQWHLAGLPKLAALKRGPQLLSSRLAQCCCKRHLSISALGPIRQATRNVPNGIINYPLVQTIKPETQLSCQVY